MPFKRVAINQGRQPRALVKGAVGGVCVCVGWGRGSLDQSLALQEAGSGRAGGWSCCCSSSPLRSTEATTDEVGGFALMREE